MCDALKISPRSHAGRLAEGEHEAPPRMEAINQLTSHRSVRLLRCGWHRCRKVCHVAGECENCDQICLKPRKLCGHPCPLPCHSPSACSVEVPCEKLIEVSCSCGHVKQQVKCHASTSKPEGNQGRLLKCSDACVVAKRNAALAEALGIEKERQVKVKEVEYEAQVLSFYSANVVRQASVIHRSVRTLTVCFILLQAWCNKIEADLIEFVKGEKQSQLFPVMKRPQRAFVSSSLVTFCKSGC